MAPQALALQAKGTLAKHFGKPQHAVSHCTKCELLPLPPVHLESPDSALVERYAGKRVEAEETAADRVCTGVCGW